MESKEIKTKVYKKVMFPTLLQCGSCSQAMAVNGLYQCETQEQLEKFAEKTHSEMVLKQKVICAEPKLTVIYSLGITE